MLSIQHDQLAEVDLRVIFLTFEVLHYLFNHLEK